MIFSRCPLNLCLILKLDLPSKQILTVPSLYGGWPVREGCVNSKQSSAELWTLDYKIENGLKSGRTFVEFLAGAWSAPIIGHTPLLWPEDNRLI